MKNLNFYSLFFVCAIIFKYRPKGINGNLLRSHKRLFMSTSDCQQVVSQLYLMVGIVMHVTWNFCEALATQQFNSKKHLTNYFLHKIIC